MLGNSLARSFETVVTVDAAEYMSSLSIDVDDEIYIKINCEGSEFEILQSLRQSGYLDRITAGLLSLDRGKKDQEPFDDMDTLRQIDLWSSGWTVRDSLRDDAVEAWLSETCQTLPSPELRLFSVSISLTASSIPVRTRVRIKDGSRFRAAAVRLASRFGRQARFKRQRPA